MEGLFNIGIVIGVIWLVVLLGRSVEILYKEIKEGLTLTQFLEGVFSFAVSPPMICLYLYLGSLFLAVKCSG